MEKKEFLFVEQRAIHLAIMYLTRRDDLVVTQPDVDYGLDILVEISQENKATGRMFGVQIKAGQYLKITPDGSSGNREVKIAIELPSALEDLPFPLCLFVFQMDNDAGFYRWLNEPVIDEEGLPRLVLHKENLFKPLTKDELDTLVEQVNTWYEKRRISEYQEAVYA